MKNLFFTLLAFTLLFSMACSNKNDEIARLKAKNDSLLSLGFQKDTTVMEFVKTFNEIQANLDSIKTKEHIISQNTSGGELKTNAKDQVAGDINAIYTMLEKNRALVADLKSKLKKTESKLAHSNENIAQLQKMIENMTSLVETKNAEIAELKSQLSKMNIQVHDMGGQISNLNQTVTDLNTQNEAKQKDLETKNATLNTAYYIIGTTKELKEKKIISKEGGFIGMGKTKTLNPDFDKSSFTKVDITNLTEIPIYKKNVKILSAHPAGSYKLSSEGKKSVDKLEILNFSDFWSTSKYLVIVAD